MTALAQTIMAKLYGEDIWKDFRPSIPPGPAQGWNGNHQSLGRLASTPGAPVVVDVGVWKGQSTITMANAMKKARINGCVLAVDTFLGSSEHWAGTNTVFTRAHGRPDLYETFLSNVFNADLSDYVVPVPQTSLTAAKVLRQLQITAAVVHVDASHEYEDVARDAEEYWHLLSPGGFMIGDDYHESWPGVVRAAGEFSAKVGRALSIEGPKWILQKART